MDTDFPSLPIPNSSLWLNSFDGYYLLRVCLAVKVGAIKEHSKKRLSDNSMVDHTF